MKLLIFLPYYNEEKTLNNVLKKIRYHIDGIFNYKILIVDDGSEKKIDKNIINLDKIIDVIRHNTNKGLGEAFNTAQNYFIEKNYDIMVGIDSDDQFNVEDIKKLINPIIEDKADVTIASRFKDHNFAPINMPFIKKIGNKIFSQILSFLCGKKYFDVSCGFRAYSKNALLHINIFGKFTYTHETLIDLVSKKFRVIEIPSLVKYHNNRKSKISGSLLKYTFATITIILKIVRDYHPMPFFSSIAFVNLIVSSGFGSIFLNHYLTTGKFTGYLFAGFLSGFFFLLSTFLFFIGLAMDMLVRIRLNQEKIIFNQNKIKK